MKVLMMAALMALASCSSHRDKVVKDGAIQPPLSETFKEQISIEAVVQHIEKWPSASRMAAERMMEKHGAPQGVTEDMLVWHDIAPYRRTIIHREGIRHDGKRPHLDLMEHVTVNRSRVCEGQDNIVKL